MDNSVYSKVDYDSMLASKKQVLAAQINCLNILKNIDSYKDLRKKEFMLKLKVKNNFKEIKESLSRINENMPKKAYDELKEIEKINKTEKILTKTSGEKEDRKGKVSKEALRESSIEEELLNIQKRLAHLN
ncbi:MAG: hypothetical protein AABX03_02535 [Nanoarchaeota archaeon]